MPHTILVVEDNIESRKLISLLLRRFFGPETEIFEAEDGVDGIAQARSTHPDIIIMDIQMPRMDGITAIRILNEDEKTRDIPVIVLSANKSTEESQAAERVGACALLSKPIDIPAFVESVRRHLT